MTRHDIEDLTHRYAHAVCTRDESEWAQTWDVDGVWELGNGNRVNGREAVVALWKSAMGSFEAVVQNVLDGTCILDEISGIGTGRWSIIEHWSQTSGDRGILLGCYDDRYVKRDRDWLFASRELVAHYMGPSDLSGKFLNASR